MTTITVTTMTMTMTTKGRSSCTVLGLALLAGCAAGTGPFAQLLEEPAPREPGNLAGRGFFPQASGPRLPIPEEATAADYVRLALERNPAIRAARHRVERLGQRIPQANSLDDPMVHVAPVGEMAETAAGQVGLMTGVSQRLPFPGKRSTRGRIAAAEMAEAAQDLERVRLEVAADTRRAWWGYYYAARAIEVTQRSRELLAQLRQVAESKLRAGTVSQPDVLRASVELSQLDNELVGLEQRQTSARAMLNRLIDRTATDPLPVPVVRRLAEITVDLEALLAEAQRANPAVRAAHERIEAFRQRLELARLGRWPDLNVSFSYNLVDDEGLSAVANGDDQWWVGLGFNLPIWVGRLEAAEAEALRGIQESIAELADARNRVAFRVQDALATVESTQRQTIVFRDVIVPQARQTVDASLSGYRAGQLDFLTLVDNWRRLLEFQLMYHDSLARLEQRFADLQEAVGRDLARQPAERAP